MVLNLQVFCLSKSMAIAELQLTLINIQLSNWLLMTYPLTNNIKWWQIINDNCRVIRLRARVRSPRQPGGEGGHQGHLPEIPVRQAAGQTIKPGIVQNSPVQFRKYITLQYITLQYNTVPERTVNIVQDSIVQYRNRSILKYLNIQYRVLEH